MSSHADLESHNIAEIEALNQRGGRTLSFVDLIKAGTLSAEMAGEFAALVEAGSSVLTAARLGGVGKSTVLAGLLACLRPGERIHATPGLSDVEQAAAASAESDTCYLAHEIGRGHYYAYLWGPAAAQFFGLPAEHKRIATCLHADEIDEVYRILDGQNVPLPTIRSLGLVVFIKRIGELRRIDSVYLPGPKAHCVRWLWEEAEDVFVPQGPSPVDATRSAELADVFHDLVEKDVCAFADVRAELAKVLRPSS